MAAKFVEMLKLYRGPDGYVYESGRTYLVSRQVAASWVRTGRAKLVKGQALQPNPVVKAFNRAPAHQAHDHPMDIRADGSIDPPPKRKPGKSPHVELPMFHIDQMNQAELLDWLDKNVDDHNYDRRFGVDTLRHAVKTLVKKKHSG